MHVKLTLSNADNLCLIRASLSPAHHRPRRPGHFPEGDVKRLDPRDLGIRRRLESRMDSSNEIERQARHSDDDRDFVHKRRGEHKRKIKVLWQERHRAKVYQRSEEQGENHVVVPSGDFQCDHDELIQDQSGEGDRDDVDELGLEEEEGEKHDHAALVD